MKNMQRIKICYRADFSQPIGALNPMGLKFAGTLTVELRQTRLPQSRKAAIWAAFRPNTKEQFREIAEQSTFKVLAEQAAMLFESQLTDWQMFEILEPPNGQACRIDPACVFTDKLGRTFRHRTV